jgi:hypothetical protein
MDARYSACCIRKKGERGNGYLMRIIAHFPRTCIIGLPKQSKVKIILPVRQRMAGNDLAAAAY